MIRDINNIFKNVTIIPKTEKTMTIHITFVSYIYIEGILERIAIILKKDQIKIIHKSFTNIEIS